MLEWLGSISGGFYKNLVLAMMNKGSKLNPFPIESIRMPFRILIIGPSESGKTSACMEILMHFKDVPKVMVMNNTEAANPKYKDHVPDVLIHEKYEHECVVDFLQVQEEKCYYAAQGRAIDTRSILVYDDLQSSAREWGRNPLTIKLATAGRNLQASWICLFQTSIVKGIEGDIRDQFTHVMIYPFDGRKEKAKIREYYCDILSQHELDSLFNNHLAKYECLVYDRTKGPQTPLVEKLFYLQARKEFPPFRTCHPDWWSFNKVMYDKDYKAREIQQNKEARQQRVNRGAVGLYKRN